MSSTLTVSRRMPCGANGRLAVEREAERDQPQRTLGGMLDQLACVRHALIKRSRAVRDGQRDVDAQLAQLCRIERYAAGEREDVRSGALGLGSEGGGRLTLTG